MPLRPPFALDETHERNALAHHEGIFPIISPIHPDFRNSLSWVGVCPGRQGERRRI